MRLGVIGLGRMGANIVRRLIRNGHECVVFNRSSEKVKQLVTEGAIAALYQRFSSRGEDEFAGKILSAMRFQFGGHTEQHE
jgi:6-phosphogluconate dehydrogenase (decarboxylating)